MKINSRTSPMDGTPPKSDTTSEESSPASPETVEVALQKAEDEAAKAELAAAEVPEIPMLTDDEVDAAWDAVERTPLRGLIDKSKFEARQQFSKLMAVQITAEIVGVNLIETSEILMEALRSARGTAANPKTSVRSKLLAIEQITANSKAQVEVSKEVLKLFKPKRRTQEEEFRPIITSTGALGPSGDGPMILAQNVQINAPVEAKSGSLPPSD